MEKNSVDRRDFFRSVAGGVFGSLALMSVPESSHARYLVAGDQPTSAADENFWKLVREQFPLQKSKTFMNNGTVGAVALCSAGSDASARRAGQHHR